MSTPNQENSSFFTLDIGGMTCASCVSRVEKALMNTPGVEAATVNLATEQARIRFLTPSTDSLEKLITSIQKMGYEASPSSPLGDQSNNTKNSYWGENGLGRVLISFALSAPIALPMLLMPLGIHWALAPKWQLLLATPVQFFFGWRFYRSGFKSLLAGIGNMDLLVALGTSSAYGLSVYELLNQSNGHQLYFEGAVVVISMVLLGKWLEAKAKKETGEAIRSLKKLWPESAKVINPYTSIDQSANPDQYRNIPLEQVLPGDHVLVLPGERIPVDGKILAGISNIDESLLTGESIPVLKMVDSKVIGGSLNGESLLIIEAMAVGTESVLAKIITLVEDTQTQKPPIQKLVDQVSAIFVPSVILIAVISAIANWIAYDSMSIAILRSVSILVIACPCALGLATPAAIMAGTGIAAKFGILIKDPQVLEEAHRIDIVVFDKTGTITVGDPSLTAIIPFEINPSEKLLNEILSTTAGLQLGSEHPLAKALLAAVKIKGLQPISSVDNKAIPGIGLQGKPSAGLWANKTLCIQSVQSLKNHPQYELINEYAQTQFEAGQTVSALIDVDLEQTPLAIIAFGDTVKPNAKTTIKSLHSLGIKTAMISGDNIAAANKVGKSIGIGKVYAQIMPADKAEIIKDLQTKIHNSGNIKRHWVAMIGDGINDAPALAAADIGMAMSTGTDVAMQAAGITLMHGDLNLVIDAIDISKRTWNKIRQNLFWAFIFNAIGIPLAALGLLSPALAGSAMALSSFFVLSNALLLKQWKPTSFTR